MTKKKWFLIVLMAALAASAALAEAANFGAKGSAKNAEPTLSEMLTYAIQDEYLARAEYELIMEEYGTRRPFSNIMKAEERHIERVEELFRTYGYPIPEDTAKDHVILPPNLKSAYETGIQAEIDNIAMYESFLAHQLPGDVRQVFEQLKAASENHLRAFRNNLARYN